MNHTVGPPATITWEGVSGRSLGLLRYLHYNHARLDSARVSTSYSPPQVDIITLTPLHPLMKQTVRQVSLVL